MGFQRTGARHRHPHAGGHTREHQTAHPGQRDDPLVSRPHQRSVGRRRSPRPVGVRDSGNRDSHRCASVGYVLDEDDRKGKFDREKAEAEFGIPPGPKYSKLHRGEAVEHEGETIQPEAVVGPPRPGRRFVYTGDTLPTESVIEASEGADLLVHDATFAEDRKERAKATAHSTAREAADVARQAGASTLALTHISTRYAASADQLVGEARDAFDGEVVLAEDGMERRVEFPDADEY